MYDANLIAPFRSGLSQYYKPFLIGNDAFTTLDNVYSWRGVVKKREGSTIIANVGAWGSFSAISNTTPPVVTFASHGLITGDSVFLTNVKMTNGTVTSVIPGIGTVVNLSGAPGISIGQTVVLEGVIGISTTDPLMSFNDTIWYVTAIGASSITLNVTTMGTYISGGTVYLGALNNQSFQITVLTANTFSLQILNSNPAVNQPASGSSSTSGSVYLPIVGTRIFIDSGQNEKLIVFTPRQAFEYNIATQVFDNISFNRSSTPILWGGNKDNYFYTSNYAGSLWATNNVFGTANQPVGIRIFNGSLTAGWQDFQPQLLSNSTTFLNSSVIILPYKGYMVTLNTTEGPADNSANINYFNRARWSQLGTPYYQSAPPLQFGYDVNAWVTDIIGKGGFTDADTNEKIVSAAIIQDTLIVGFQFSTWRLRFTGNFIQPFIWERINTQLGSEATFSAVSFDQSVLMISRRGIIGATFNDVQRIDLEVPDFVNRFDTGLNELGMNRIQGIRDYQKRLVYWLYCDEASNNQTPNKILCYNYEDNTWSTFTQSFTTLANYQLTNSDNTWQTWFSEWVGDTSTWNTPLEQSNTPIVVAGDLQGNVWQIMNQDYSADNGVNYNFTITTNIFNPYFQKGKRCKLAFYDLYITNTDYGQITLENYINDDPSDPWLIKTVDTNDNALAVKPVKNVKYIRVFLGQIARNHQVTLTLTDEQLADPLIGTSNFELQGIIMHSREEGRIKE
jgi:hypothetical protein